MSDTTKHVADVLSVGAFLAAVLEWLPEATVFLTFVWVLMRMAQTWQELRLNNRKLRGDD